MSATRSYGVPGGYSKMVHVHAYSLTEAYGDDCVGLKAEYRKGAMCSGEMVDLGLAGGLEIVRVTIGP